MKTILLSITLSCLCAFSCFGQGSESSKAMKDANNPLASIKSISVHNIYSSSLCGIDGTANTAWIRYAQPVNRILLRASMPINTINIGPENHSGLGDMNIFGTYILTDLTSHNQLGIGPLLSVPTATQKFLGSGKWNIGFAFVGYFAKSNIFQFGFLATWQHSFSGNDNRRRVHAASIQPFLMWQLDKGLYLRSTAISILDFEKGNYLVPVGLGMGKVLKIGKVLCNFFAEPQFAVWNKAYGLPKTQLFIGVNTQF